MRLIFKAYSDGKRSIYRTDDDGNNPQLLAGTPDPEPSKIKRMTVFIEVSCDDTWGAISRVKRALEKELPLHLRPRSKRNGKN